MFHFTRLTIFYFTATVICTNFFFASSAPAVKSIEALKSACKKCLQSKQKATNHHSQANLTRLRRETNVAKEEVFDSIIKMEIQQKQDRDQVNRLMKGKKTGASTKSNQIIHVYQPDSREHASNSVVLGLKKSFRE